MNIIGYAVFVAGEGFKQYDTEAEAKEHGDMVFPIVDVEIIDILEEVE